ncbi:MAG: hypothetical protein DRI74_06545 [Bacteroidetes bacterium]|nr:MAG: hypothetical protein DRI74_06545 [Bacteroidota bacterium]
MSVFYFSIDQKTQVDHLLCTVFFEKINFILFGGIFFSDSILVINKFTLEMSLALVLVMETYTFAQWLLVM